jgi:hypothetical protein
MGLSRFSCSDLWFVGVKAGIEGSPLPTSTPVETAALGRPENAVPLSPHHLEHFKRPQPRLPKLRCH